MESLVLVDLCVGIIFCGWMKKNDKNVRIY